MGLERRRADRHAFSATAEITDEKENARSSSRVSDLSLNGCYLEMANPFAQGTPVLVEIYTDTDFVEAHATVAYREAHLGMGVEFADMPPHFAAVLKKWLNSSARTAGERHKKPV